MKKSIVFTFLITASSVFGQVWHYHRQLPPIYSPSKIKANVNNQLFLINSNFLYMLDTNQSAWKLVENGIGPRISDGLFEINPTIGSVYIDNQFSIYTIQNINNYNQISGTHLGNFLPEPSNGIGSPVFNVISSNNSVYAFCSELPNLSTTHVFKSLDNGVNWNDISTFDQSSLATLAVSSSEFLVSTSDFPAGGGTIYRSTNTGLNWSTVSTDPTYVYEDFELSFGSVIYTIQRNSFDMTSNAYKLLKSYDNGTNWTEVPFETQKLYDLIYHSETNQLYVCGSKGIYSLSLDNGTFTNESFNLNNADVFSFDRVNNQLYCFSSLGGYSSVYTKSNNGNNWVPFNNGLELISDNDQTFGFSQDSSLVTSAFTALFKENTLVNNWMISDLPVASNNNNSTYFKNFSNDFYLSKADQSGHTLLKTTDFGNTYDTLNTTQYAKILAHNSTHLLIGDDPQFPFTLKKFDEITENETTVFSATTIIQDVFMANDGSVLIHDLNGCQITHDNGQSFSTPLPNDNYFKLISGDWVYFFSNLSGNLTLRKINLATETIVDLNSDWTLLNNPTTSTSFKLIAHDSLIAMFLDNELIYSSDGGLTFITLPTPFGNQPPTFPATYSGRKFEYQFDLTGKLYAQIFDYNSPLNGYYYLNMNESAGIQVSTNIKSLIYPNPTTGVIQINVNQDVDVMVYDQFGKQIKAEKATQQIDMSAYDAGIYTIKIIGSNGETSISKIVKN